MYICICVCACKCVCVCFISIEIFILCFCIICSAALIQSIAPNHMSIICIFQEKTITTTERTYQFALTKVCWHKQQHASKYSYDQLCKYTYIYIYMNLSYLSVVSFTYLLCGNQYAILNSKPQNCLCLLITNIQMYIYVCACVCVCVHVPNRAPSTGSPSRLRQTANGNRQPSAFSRHLIVM